MYFFNLWQQGGPGIVKQDHGLVLSKVALGAELTTYVSRDLAFFGQIRLDFIDNTCSNTRVRARLRCTKQI